MNEKQKIFAAGTAFGMAAGFGVASFVFALGALYVAPQILDAAEQRAMVSHPPSQVQGASLFMADTSFPMNGATASSKEKRDDDVVHVRAVQGGGIGGPVTDGEIPLPNVPNAPVIPALPLQMHEAAQQPQVIIVEAAPMEPKDTVLETPVRLPESQANPVYPATPVVVTEVQSEASASQDAESRIAFLGEAPVIPQTP